MSAHDDVVGIALGGVLAWHPHSLDAVVQRPLLPLANRPWMEHFIEWLRAAGVERAALSVTRPSDAVLELTRKLNAALGDLQLFVDGSPRGAAGCCRDVAEQMPAARYLVVECSVIPRVDGRELLAQHRAARAAATVVVDADAPDDDGHDAHLSPVGIHVLEREFLMTTPETGYQDLKETLINRAVAQGERVSIYRASARNPRICDLASYLEAQELLIPDNGWASDSLFRAESRDFGSRVRVGAAAEIAASARIIGPVIVGARTVIGQDASIIGPCVIGPDCRVRENAVISDCVLWNDCSVGAAAVLSECVLVGGTSVAPRARHERELLLGAVST